MEHEHPDTVRAGRRRNVLITGAGGQLGQALQDVFAEDDLVALGRGEWDVTGPLDKSLLQGMPDLLLHTAAWTNVDGAEADPQGAAAVNVGGTANAAALGVPLVAFSSDYVFDGRKGAPYVESDSPNPLSAYGRTKLHSEAAAGSDAWIVRSSWLFGPTGHNFVRTMLALAAERGRSRRGRRPARIPDVRRASGSRRARPRRGEASKGNLACRRRRRLHVGGIRRGDLRGDGTGLPCSAHLDRGARSPGAPPRARDPA